jgi:5-methylcytosine-specific restriction protein A
LVLGELGAGLVDEGSPGQGNWAAVPWISVFDPAITTSATRGYYVVYLFHANEPVVHLSLNQGTTAVREEFAGKTREVLADRAEFMRKRVAVTYDVAADFAVLCANCHRMIHRTDDPSNLSLFRENLPSNKS